ncbi:MAG TPA: hypothetical protein VGS57_09095 [Thermoanaerobaculia bacterium]|nr:hypothetical protein [Thermoanaerobaculia bacterium]
MRDSRPSIHMTGPWIRWSAVTTAVAASILLSTAPLHAARGNKVLAIPEDAFPTSIRYEGQAKAADGRPLEGKHVVDVAVFDKSGATQLWSERFENVAVSAGQFAVDIGAGQRLGAWPIASMQAVFASNYQVELEVTFDGTKFGPRVGLLPAGHSLESRMVIDGLRQPNDGQRHWNWYDHRSDVSSFQAAVLSPGASGQRSDESGPNRARPFLLKMEGPWLSRPVRELPLAADDPLPAARGEEGERPAVDAELENGVAVKEINPPRHESLVDELGRPFGTVARQEADELAIRSRQAAMGPQLQTPSPSVNFEGVNNIDGFYPPDIEMAVGPNHIVQVTNVSFAIYDKTGAVVNAPVHTNQLWSGMPASEPCRTENDGDAIFLYDRHANRWVLTQFAVPSGSERVCFAVSTTSDPTGTYYLYAMPSQRFPDYFKIGVWPDPANNAYFLGTNSGQQGQYDVYAIDRDHLLSGSLPRTAQFFQSMPNLQMPADNDGPNPPPAGSPGIFYSFRDGGEPYFGSPPADSLDIREYHIDWSNSANSTFTLVQSLTAADGFANFNWTICGFFVNNCLPQPGTSVAIDSASWWPMQRLAYRNFGTSQSLVGAWTVDTMASGNHAAPRWFELRRTTQTSGNWSIFQQGTHSPDGDSGDHRWMPSIAMDGSANIAIGFSAVNAATNTFPSIRYAARLAGDTPGTLQTEVVMQAGSGSQTGSAGRWGDYSAMEIDPVDDCTFWYTNEYLTTTGGAPWRTRIAAFRFPSCGSPEFSLNATPSVMTVCAPNNAVYTVNAAYFGGLTDAINLSASGNPAGTTVGFSTTPLTTGSLSSTMTISGITAANNGLHSITVTGDTGTINHNSVVQLQVGGPLAPTLVSPADSSTPATTQPTFQWSSVVSATGYTIEIATDAAFTTIVSTGTPSGTSFTPAAALAVGTQHWWRVRATNGCGSGPNSAVRTFTTPVVYCRTLSLAIPDGVAAGVNDDLVIPATGNILDLNLYIKATHTWVGDLKFTLSKVSGPSVVAFDRPGVPASTFGCNSDNLDNFLDDEGAGGPVESACPVAPGVFYTPNNPLTAFDNQSLTGTWRLNAADLASSDVGTLTQWCIVPVTGVPVLLSDGFESGNLSAWAGSIP